MELDTLQSRVNIYRRIIAMHTEFYDVLCLTIATSSICFDLIALMRDRVHSVVLA